MRIIVCIIYSKWLSQLFDIYFVFIFKFFIGNFGTCYLRKLMIKGTFLLKCNFYNSYLNVIAHEILSDPQKRKQYDLQKKYGGSFGGFQAPDTFSFHGSTFDDLFSVFDEFRGNHHDQQGNHFNLFEGFSNFFDSVSIR